MTLAREGRLSRGSEAEPRETLGEVSALLRELVVGQREIIRLLQQQRAPSHITRRDREQLGRLLPAITGVFGSELFTVREVFSHDSPALRIVLADVNRKQLGRLLQRAEGAFVGGFTVARDGSEVGAALWRILATTA